MVPTAGLNTVVVKRNIPASPRIEPGPFCHFANRHLLAVVASFPRPLTKETLTPLRSVSVLRAWGCVGGGGHFAELVKIMEGTPGIIRVG